MSSFLSSDLTQMLWLRQKAVQELGRDDWEYGSRDRIPGLKVSPSAD